MARCKIIPEWVKKLENLEEEINAPGINIQTKDNQNKEVK